MLLWEHAAVRELWKIHNPDNITFLETKPPSSAPHFGQLLKKPIDYSVSRNHNSCY